MQYFRQVSPTRHPHLMPLSISAQIRNHCQALVRVTQINGSPAWEAHARADLESAIAFFTQLTDHPQMVEELVSNVSQSLARLISDVQEVSYRVSGVIPFEQSTWFTERTAAILGQLRKIQDEQFEHKCRPPADNALEGLSAELWSAAQLAPGEGIADGVARIKALLQSVEALKLIETSNEGLC